MQTQFDIETPLPELTRILIWFSCGGTSAVSAKLAIKENAGRLPVVVAYNETGSHHPDNARFLADCARWLGCEIVTVRNQNFRDVDDVIEKVRYLNGPTGAACTRLLKIIPRTEFQRANTDRQVFGFHAGETDRAFDFRRNFPSVRLWTPLIERGLFHADCLAILRDVGIEVPKMYKDGFLNNNCLGCVKGGKGYWNKIRVLHPDVFNRRAKQEREIGHSCIKGCFLDELDPAAGRHEEPEDIACEGVCVNAMKEIQNCES